MHHTNGPRHAARIMICTILTLFSFSVLANDCDVKQREDGCSDPINTGLYDNTFHKSCKMHDRCYATAGMSKSKCDNHFKRSMKSACEDLSFFEEPPCKLSADIYYEAVDIFGGPSYDNGQNWSDNHCTHDDWWSEIYRGHGDQVSCPDEMVMAGRYHLSEDDGFSQYFCTRNSSDQVRSSVWFTVTKGNSFVCPGNQVIVGMEKKKNGKFALRCAELLDTLVGSPSWSSQINNGNGKTYYCPNNKVLVGFKKNDSGDVKYACASA